MTATNEPYLVAQGSSDLDLAWGSRSAILGGYVEDCSPAALDAFAQYWWPGNVRQLENVIERAFALSPGRTQIQLSDLPPEFKQLPVSVNPDDYVLPESGLELDHVVAKFEHALIRRALRRTSMRSCANRSS